MPAMGAIYGIRSSLTGTICYVGQTRGCVNGRFADHRKGKTAISKAIRLFGEDSFTAVVLEQVPVDKLNVAETFWISRLKTLVPVGLNCTEGGSAGPRSAATRARMSAARKAVWQRDGFREKAVEALAASWTDERRSEHREMTAAQMKNAVNRERISASNKGRQRSDETKARLAELQKERWSDPAYREKAVAVRTGRVMSDAHRAKISEGAARRELTPELRAKYSEAANRRWAKAKAEISDA